MHERGRYAALLDQANDILWAMYALNPDLEQKIVAVLDRIRIRQEGEPMTEFEDEPTPMGDGPDTQTNKSAQKFLLKKAWRLVRTLVHPDKGTGQQREEFQVLKAAYEAGDLNALTEYVLASQKTVLEQIAHWRTEVAKPAINWQVLQRMPAFRVVRAFMAGQRDLAAELAFHQRTQRLHELELEELSMG